MTQRMSVVFVRRCSRRVVCRLERFPNDQLCALAFQLESGNLARPRIEMCELGRQTRVGVDHHGAGDLRIET